MQAFISNSLSNTVLYLKNSLIIVNPKLIRKNHLRLDAPEVKTVLF